MQVWVGWAAAAAAVYSVMHEWLLGCITTSKEKLQCIVTLILVVQNHFQMGSHYILATVTGLTPLMAHA